MGLALHMTYDLLGEFVIVACVLSSACQQVADLLLAPGVVGAGVCRAAGSPFSSVNNSR